MKKLLLTSLLMTSVTFPLFAFADNHTVSLGYAQSKVQDFKDIKGVNLKYRYEWDSPLSIIGSLTYMSGKESYTYLVTKDIMTGNSKLKYYSLAIGPAYRFNNYISLYALAGLNYNKADSKNHWSNYESGSYSDQGYIKYSGKKTSFMYSAGLQINPTENWAVDVGYEGSSFSDDVKTRSINGFNIGIGYRF